MMPLGARSVVCRNDRTAVKANCKHRGFCVRCLRSESNEACDRVGGEIGFEQNLRREIWAQVDRVTWRTMLSRIEMDGL